MKNIYIKFIKLGKKNESDGFNDEILTQSLSQGNYFCLVKQPQSTSFP